MIRALPYHTGSAVFSYFYAFANGLIPDREFENWVCSSLDFLSQELCSDPELFTELLECDYCSDNDIEHLKCLLRNRYELTALSYEQFIGSSDEKLIKIMNDHLYDGSNIIFDCTGIDTPYKLHKKIQAIFKYPEWYGKNWHAFEDLIDISEVCVIRIININKIRESIPYDTECFLKIIKRNMSENCQLIFESR